MAERYSGMSIAANKRLNKGRKKLGLRHFVPNFSQAFYAC